MKGALLRPIAKRRQTIIQRSLQRGQSGRRSVQSRPQDARAIRTRKASQSARAQPMSLCRPANALQHRFKLSDGPGRDGVQEIEGEMHLFRRGPCHGPAREAARHGQDRISQTGNDVRRRKYRHKQPHSLTRRHGTSILELRLTGNLDASHLCRVCLVFGRKAALSRRTPRPVGGMGAYPEREASWSAASLCGVA